MTPQRYRPKSLDFDAMQWDGTPEGATPIIDWVLSRGGTARWHEERLTDTNVALANGAVIVSDRKIPVPTHIAVNTPNGTEKAHPGDWVVFMINGEWANFAVSSNEEFTETFELVTD